MRAFCMMALTLALLLPGRCQAGQPVQCFCLQAKGGSFVLRMSFEDEAWKVGHVQYKGQTGSIPLRYVGYKELESFRDRPSYFRYTWQEVIGGRVTGTYVVCIQGANIYESWYIRKKDNRKFVLEHVQTDGEECANCL